MTTTSDTIRPEALAELEQGLEQMKTANYYLRVALDQVADGVLIVEAEPFGSLGHRVLFSNATAAVMVGVEPEKGLRGMGITDLVVSEEDKMTLRGSLLLAVENGGVHECECALINHYGHPPQRYRWRVRAVFSSMRKLLNYTLLVSPVSVPSTVSKTDSKSADDDLDAPLKQLGQENLASLAQSIAHDVNHLLGPVTARLSNLVQQVGNQPVLQEELQLISGALRRARQFTSQVVNVGKDRQPQVVKPVDITPIIRDTVKLTCAGSHVNARVHISESLRWPIVNAVQISQVLQNLILNGVQSMPQGGYMDIDARNIDIAAGDDPVLSPGSYVRLVVRDRGCGIAPEHLQRLFGEQFTTKAGGTGIGLRTCKRVMQAHNGDIRVSSRVNVGTEFTVFLPAAAAPYPARTRRMPFASGPVPLQQGQGRVLIVDDEDDLRKVAYMILQRCGYTVFECDNGQDAIKIYQSLARTFTPPDVVLMDLTLRGGMNGAETAETILRIDPNARLVVTSGSVSEEVQHSFLDKGFVGVLPKPYEADELTQMVHQVTSSMMAAAV